MYSLCDVLRIAMASTTCSHDIDLFSRNSFRNIKAKVLCDIGEFMMKCLLKFIADTSIKIKLYNYLCKKDIS